jgi:hypothetical protein
MRYRDRQTLAHPLLTERKRMIALQRVAHPAAP